MFHSKCLAFSRTIKSWVKGHRARRSAHPKNPPKLRRAERIALIFVYLNRFVILQESIVRAPLAKFQQQLFVQRSWPGEVFGGKRAWPTDSCCGHTRSSDRIWLTRRLGGGQVGIVKHRVEALRST